MWSSSCILLFVLSPFGTIAAGERGVHLRFTAPTGKVFGEGLYFRIPLMESVQKMDIKIQKEEMRSDAASKDLQTVHSMVALNFHVDPRQVAKIYQEVGLDFKNRIIDPAMQEAIKASTAKFTAEELITKRELVRDDIKAQLSTRLKQHDILVDEFNIVNFEFSKVFNDAIEAKVTAEQSALAAKNKLEQIKFEAEQKVAEAKRQGGGHHDRVECTAFESADSRTARAGEVERGTAPGDRRGGAVHQPAQVARARLFPPPDNFRLSCVTPHVRTTSVRPARIGRDLIGDQVIPSGPDTRVGPGGSRGGLLDANETAGDSALRIAQRERRQRLSREGAGVAAIPALLPLCGANKLQISRARLLPLRRLAHENAGSGNEVAVRLPSDDPRGEQPSTSDRGWRVRKSRPGQLAVARSFNRLDRQAADHDHRRGAAHRDIGTKEADLPRYV